MAEVEEWEKETSDCGRHVQQKGSPLRNHKTLTRQAHAVEESPPLCFRYKKGSCLKDKHCDY